MATKRFCDIKGCGKEVTEYPVSGFTALSGTDFKVEINILSVDQEVDMCIDCFWTAVNSMDKRDKKAAKKR